MLVDGGWGGPSCRGVGNGEGVKRSLSLNGRGQHETSSLQTGISVLSFKKLQHLFSKEKDIGMGHFGSHR